MFPQIRGLGKSELSKYFAIKNLLEAKEYFNNEYLRNNYLSLVELLLNSKENDAEKIFGYIDSRKLHSSLTLFYIVSRNQMIKGLLDKFYYGQFDSFTIRKIQDDRNIDHNDISNNWYCIVCDFCKNN